MSWIKKADSSNEDKLKNSLYWMVQACTEMKDVIEAKIGWNESGLFKEDFDNEIDRATKLLADLGAR